MYPNNEILKSKQIVPQETYAETADDQEKRTPANDDTRTPTDGDHTPSVQTNPKRRRDSFSPERKSQKKMVTTGAQI